ncbi:MAG: DUF3159 domain-containing protein, partial [Actinobacteria bacterium]|nr:DUF3159 domain-containing protein [Actinomycetota bacterium]
MTENGTPGDGRASDEAQDAAAGDRNVDPAAGSAAQAAVGGFGRAVEAGLSGETLSARGVLGAIGGWRGVLEALVPGVLFLLLYIPTRDARIAAIGPAVLALLAILVRVIRREPVVSALSGAIGVAIAFATTMVTGRGEDYFLWGFLINVVTMLVLLISAAVGWPLIGLILGALRGNLTAWREDRLLRRASLLATLLWSGVFIARLVVQVPLYLSGRVEALGVAKLLMGLPLFAIVLAFTWLVLSRAHALAGPPLPAGLADQLCVPAGLQRLLAAIDRLARVARRG